MDARLPDNTIYWIIEEDFRFWPPGCDPDMADNYDKAVVSLVEAREREGAAGSSLPPSSDTAQTDKGQQRVQTKYHTALPQGYSDEAEEEQGFCRDVVDMMHIERLLIR